MLLGGSKRYIHTLLLSFQSHLLRKKSSLEELNTSNGELKGQTDRVRASLQHPRPLEGP